MGPSERRGRRGAPTEQLRAAVRAHVVAHGYRQTSEETGVSVGGLSGYLGGAKPYARTLRKLEEWYARTAARREGAVDADLAQLALELRVRDVPEANRIEVVTGILEDLQRRYESLGIPPPAWMRELLEW